MNYDILVYLVILDREIHVFDLIFAPPCLSDSASLVQNVLL